MELQQLTDFIRLIQVGHSDAGAASQLSPKMLPDEVMEFLKDPDQAVWYRSYKIARNEALFDVEAKYLSASPSTRNFQAELSARAPDQWSFRSPSPSSRERSGRSSQEPLAPLNFAPPSQLFPNAAVSNSAAGDPAEII